jgi:hypothetical protein
MLGGLTGDSAFIRHHIDRSERLADEARSPLLRLWTVEVRIEYLSGIGEWDAAVALGERSIVLARDFGQRTLLPRLLVWTALLHVDRGDLERERSTSTRRGISPAPPGQRPRTAPWTCT